MYNIIVPMYYLNNATCLPCKWLIYKNIGAYVCYTQ